MRPGLAAAGGCGPIAGGAGGGPAGGGARPEPGGGATGTWRGAGWGWGGQVEEGQGQELGEALGGGGAERGAPLSGRNVLRRQKSLIAIRRSL